MIFNEEGRGLHKNISIEILVVEVMGFGIETLRFVPKGPNPQNRKMNLRALFHSFYVRRFVVGRVYFFWITLDIKVVERSSDFHFSIYSKFILCSTF